MCISRFLPPAKEVWGKVIFLHLSVILFTRGGGVSGQVPPGRYTPGQVHPPGRYSPSPSVHAWIRSTSGRYASYWNAFLFLLILDERWPTFPSFILWWFVERINNSAYYKMIYRCQNKRYFKRIRSSC